MTYNLNPRSPGLVRRSGVASQKCMFQSKKLIASYQGLDKPIIQKYCTLNSGPLINSIANFLGNVRIWLCPIAASLPGSISKLDHTRTG